MGCSVKWSAFFCLVMAIVASTVSFSVADTDPRDVFAINGLFVSLGFPPLRGWLPFGGDPCGDQWQGVSCVFSNITAINLNGLNLGGTLADDIGLLTSLIVLDVSDNLIGGNIPSNLPPTLRNLSFARNQFDGNIPDTLSSLSELLDLSFHNNLLSGEIPDAFQYMMSLINLDMSGNNLSGQLPPSMGNLSSLTKLHLQNNELTGTLDVLQDLPLEYLNVQNNLFSGPIPDKLLGIPNFRREGNPFNTSVVPSSSPALPPSLGISPFAVAPVRQGNGPSASEGTPKSRRSKPFFTTKRVTWIAVLGVGVCMLLLACFLVSACCKRRRAKEYTVRHDAGAYKERIENSHNRTSFPRNNQEEKVPKESVVKLQDQHGLYNRRPEAGPKTAAYSWNTADHVRDATSVDMNFMSLQPPPPPPPTSNKAFSKVIVNPSTSSELRTRSYSNKRLNSCSVRAFTIASLQQYTNSFSEENFVGEGNLGSVYKAELPDGSLLAVKKLNSTASRLQSDDEFLELVSTIFEIRHTNIVELVGYCNEYGQRLLVYKYCECGTLYDALHVDDDMHEKLSWHGRIRLALGAARALQYMHEVCQPPMVHRDFKSSNILLDDKLAARVSDCGLVPLKSICSSSEVSGHLLTANGYDAPEIELGSYTFRSDVYSFGVVMLELLTGRKPYDRSRGRWGQSLVRWAIPQLHDIDALCRMVDPSLNGAYPIKSLSRFADIISRCVQWEPEFRPPISEVVQDLLHML